MTYFPSAGVEDVDRDWIWRMLSSEAYWGRWRTRADVDAQLDAAWRVIGVYDDATADQVGFARAFSDGLADAYLADVIVDPAHRGRGIGKMIVQAMIDDGPGQHFRWTLFTSDAHGLYAKYGFAAPGSHSNDPAAAPPDRRRQLMAALRTRCGPGQWLSRSQVGVVRPSSYSQLPSSTPRRRRAWIASRSADGGMSRATIP